MKRIGGPFPGSFLAERIPGFARSVLYVGGMAEEFGKTVTREVALTSQENLPRPSTTQYDCVILDGAPADPAEKQSLLEEAKSLLQGKGYLYVAVPSENRLEEQTSGTGLEEYLTWTATAPGPDGAEPVEAGRLYLFVHSTYDPLAHAVSLAGEGHPAWAYEVLSMIPQRLLESDEAAAQVAAHRQYCLLALEPAVPTERKLDQFFLEQCLFYEAVRHVPAHLMAFQVHAAYWSRMGRADMALRLLTTLAEVTPEDSLRRTREYEGQGIQIETPAPPPLPDDYRPRLLLVLPPTPNYGLDTLYDGLCSALGEGRVTDFPWKPTLHGEAPSQHAHYPCAYNRRSQPSSLEQVDRGLKDGAYDAVLWGDMRGEIPPEMAPDIRAAAEGVPLFLLDQEDSFEDFQRTVCARLGLPSPAGYFKREMLAGVDYGERTYPLPFSFSLSKMPKTEPADRTRPLFWAGHRKFGLRRLYLEHLESRLGQSLSELYPPERYANMLLESQAALSFFGFGFDTVRYWEAPAHGCMLLSEKLPIHIPHNFVDGKSAVFFDDLPELEEKVDYYLAHGDEAQAIGETSHTHFKKYHTAQARARQMLGWMAASF